MKKTVEKKTTYVIKLPDGEKITIGPGISNVPTSPDSVKETNIGEMIKAARAASRAGTFTSEDSDYGRNSNSSTR
ncbi:MAG: hypothetical protein AAB553_07035 [Patescibacteria group bacterium]